LKRFIEKRPNDRIGLVPFASQAFIATPLTLDHDFVLRNLERLHLGTIDGSQTAIGAGLSTAINRLRELKSKSKIVILMTDGRSNAGKIAPRTAAEAAQSLGVKVYTIGVGKHGQSRRPRIDRNGRYIVDMFGNKIYDADQEDLDEDLLQAMAQMTGGKYYRADNAQKFQEIYDQIDKLEKTEQQVKKYAQHRELFAWAIAPGLGLVLLEVLLRHTRFRRLP
jgi:Ca-activated chloride channel homolog